MIPMVIPMFSKTWNVEHGQDADADEHAELVPGQLGRPPDPPEDHGQQSRARRAADEAQLLPHHREDEVGVLLGHEAQPGLGALEQALAAELAGADGRLGLLLVVAAPVGVQLGVGEVGQPVLLVVGQDVAVQDRRRSPMIPISSRTAKCRGRAPATKTIANDHDAEDQHRAQVGLQHDQGHRHGRDAEDGGQARAVDVLLLQGEEGRQRR